MRELLEKSIKHNTATTIVLALVSAGLVGLLIHQSNHYQEMLKEQTEKYTEIMIEQQPDIQEFPNRKLGKFSLSWYSPKELGKTSPSELRTSRGVIPKEGRTVAVDPKVIPYGSIIYIQGYGYYIAEDCGGAIKQNRIDIFTASHQYAIQQGKKVANVWILGKI